MKILQIPLLTFSLALFAYGADLIVTVPDQDIPRVQEAYGSILNLGRNATVQEVSKATQDYIHQSTVDYERRKNTYAYTPAPMHFSPTPGGLKAAEPAKAATPRSKK